MKVVLNGPGTVVQLIRYCAIQMVVYLTNGCETVIHPIETAQAIISHAL